MTGSAGIGSGDFKARLHDPTHWSRAADVVAVLIALSLPWSTSLVSIFTLVWMIAVLPTLDWNEFLRSLKRPIAALPIGLFGLAVIGMFWSDAAWSARIHSADQTAKFLLLPLLIYRYRHSSRGHWVFISFVASCAVLMMASFGIALSPKLAALRPDVEFGVPVKNYIDQSQSFSLCAVALGYPIATLMRRQRHLAAALLAVLALLFIADLVFVTTSRTALVVLPIMLLVFAFRMMEWRGVMVSLAALAIIGSAAALVSPQLRAKLVSAFSEYQHYEDSNAPTSVGLRLEFWRKSLGFIQSAPLLGHGTGSIEGLFIRAAKGEPGSAGAEVIRNPHNQTLAVAIQWGSIGVAVLWAMWLVHLSWMLRAASMMAFVGFLVVLQNMVTSLFNSHLFDFHAGWMYVRGVGIAAGSMQRAADRMYMFRPSA